tara:strand:+ start:508 stop:627 length:120 start_codon:yes stop_codon:yes gene_type:complete
MATREINQKAHASSPVWISAVLLGGASVRVHMVAPSSNR